jgi:hypothetical protein
MNFTNAEKRMWIDTALRRDGIAQDECFTSVMEYLSIRDRNLDKVINDISAYSTSTYALQKTHQQYASARAKEWENLLFVTFTTRYELNSDALADRYESFINTLSKRTYKNAYKRHGKRIEHHSFMEGDTTNNRTHIHALIQVPDGRNINQFRTAIKECWWNTGTVHFADTDNYTDDDIDAIAEYITKTRTKSSMEGNILQNSYIP